MTEEETTAALTNGQHLLGLSSGQATNSEPLRLSDVSDSLRAPHGVERRAVARSVNHGRQLVVGSGRSPGPTSLPGLAAASTAAPERGRAGILRPRSRSPRRSFAARSVRAGPRGRLAPPEGSRDRSVAGAGVEPGGSGDSATERAERVCGPRGCSRCWRQGPGTGATGASVSAQRR